jgi:hypothetical protein
MLGVAFCGPCAREQEAYFAIGELTDEETHGVCSRPFAEALKRMRQVRAGSTEGIAAGIYHGLSDVRGGKPLALRSG